MSKLYILPYASGSKSAANITREYNALASSRNLKAVRITSRSPGFRKFFESRRPPADLESAARLSRGLFIWGGSFDNYAYMPDGGISGNKVLINSGNKSELINKKRFFEYARNALGVSNLIPTFFTSYNDVSRYYDSLPPNTDVKIVERHDLTGHSGNGIRISTRETLSEAPLYTVYMKKVSEFRVHFFRTSATNVELHISAKRQRINSLELTPSFEVRNIHNGWVYCTRDIQDIPGFNKTKQVAVTFLDRLIPYLPNCICGAVDIIYNRRADAAIVLEVNTAPGAEGFTAKWYANCLAKTVQPLNDFSLFGFDGGRALRGGFVPTIESFFSDTLSYLSLHRLDAHLQFNHTVEEDLLSARALEEALG